MYSWNGKAKGRGYYEGCDEVKCTDISDLFDILWNYKVKNLSLERRNNISVEVCFLMTLSVAVIM
jgi:hypothetical protein